MTSLDLDVADADAAVTRNGRYAEAPSVTNLDANANAPATADVVDAVVDALRTVANPSSAHGGGARARVLIERARDAVVSLAEGLFEDGVTFTSGCTEANNTVLGAVRSSGATLITSLVEHPSILEPAKALAEEGHRVVYLAVSPDGQIDVADLEALLASIDGPVLLSIQSANSETGVVQPISRIAEVQARRGGVLFHSDAAQSFGKLRTKLSASSGPHVASVSGHKLHGPMGVGALLVAEGTDAIAPMIRGGDQERGRRAGTEPVALIAGLGAACDRRAAGLRQQIETMRRLRDRLEKGILATVPGAAVNGQRSPRLANTSSISFGGFDAMALMSRLDAEGVLVSQGSACSSMRPTPSHVLTAMGLSEADAFATIRFSTSPLNTPAEIDRAIAVTASACNELGTRR